MRAEPPMTLAQRLAGIEFAQRALTVLDDRALGALLGDAERGWGWTARCTIAGRPLFVKAVPVTDREREADLSTENLYGVSPYLNYPFGSPGISVGRELAFARRSTAWVSNGLHGGFPILVHDRLIDRADARCVDNGDSNGGGFTAYRFDDDGMNQYLADRRRARSLLILVYEAFPFTAVHRLTQRPGELTTIVDDVRRTAQFLRSHQVVHFDIDMFNIVTDGRSAHVADHGLVLDAEFELDPDERRFLEANRHFDEGSLLMAVGHQLLWNHRIRPRGGIEIEDGLDDLPFDAAVVKMLDLIDDRHADELGVDPTLRVMVDRYRPVIEFMIEFAQSAKAKWDSSTFLDDARLAQLIEACDSG